MVQKLENILPKFSIVSDTFKKKCNDSTAHGLSRVFGSDFLWIRILWSILFLISFSIAIFGKIKNNFLSFLIFLQHFALKKYSFLFLNIIKFLTIFSKTVLLIKLNFY